jgi:hypothetical protein
MSRLREALDKIEEAKTMLAEAVKYALEPLKLEKIAVRVSNEREFKFLMQHYESLGWKSYGGEPVKDFPYAYDYIAFHDRFFHNTKLNFETAGYEIIDFDFFCAQKGLTPPKFMIKSQDGVDLHCGDSCYIARLIEDKWSLDWHSIGGHYNTFVVTDNGYFVDSDSKKIFHSKQNANKWIKEQNRPKEIEVKFFCKDQHAKVSGDAVRIYSHNLQIIIKPSDIEEISKALYDLQQQSDISPSK